MKLHPQTIYEGTKRVYVILPGEEYRMLIARVETLRERNTQLTEETNTQKVKKNSNVKST